MLFNSYIFVLLFLPLTIMGYYALNYFKKYSLSKVYLVGMSLWFYGFFNPSYILIMLSSILVNYYLGSKLIKLNKQKISKLLLFLGIIFNVGILFYFKYFNFFIDNINFIFKSDFFLETILLPLGISFFTFQQLSYIIDCYKLNVPNYHILDYSLFVTFFPQLVAGPIVLHSEVVPQFADVSKKKFNYDTFSKGIYAFALGMGKKVLIADTFGIFTDWGYYNINILSSTDAVFVILAYTLQIYFDFSGYCDMATGIGYMFGIELPMNFNSPYKSKTILEFWKRWHLTLTRFFTNYVYIPLGGNRKGKIILYRNIFIVFLVSGIWHGANWTFVIWGLLHGVASILTRIFKGGVSKIPSWINWVVTFIFINFAWVFFRANSLETAWTMFEKLFKFDFQPINRLLISSADTITEYGMLNLASIPLTGTILFLSVFIVCIFGAIFMKNTNQKLVLFKPTITKLLTSGVILLWSVLSFAGVSSFIYFNF